MNLFTVVSWIFSALFFVAAAVQWNDPDTLPWMAFYVVAAVVAALGALRRVPRVAPLVVGLGALTWAATLISPVFTAAEWTWNEQERELGGLILVAVFMLVLARRTR